MYEYLNFGNSKVKVQWHIRQIVAGCAVLFFTGLFAGCEILGAKDNDVNTDDPLMAGGATTILDATSHAYSTPAPNLEGGAFTKHLDGDAAFEQAFVTVPAVINPGLGPLYNLTSCIGCHVRDGRSEDSFLMRVSMSGKGAHGEPVPVPGFGTQIQDKAIFGIEPEARIDITYETITGSFGDGTTYSLQKPVYTIADTYQPLPAGVKMSPRMARPVFGLGLLEAIDETTLLEIAERQAAGNRVSGRPNYVWDVNEQKVRVGRFGWKANQPSSLQQTAAAYSGDMGVTSPLFPIESSQGQSQGDNNADDPEIDWEILDVTTFYVQTLAVPAPRDLDDPTVSRGRRLFGQIGCVDCHVDRIETGMLEGVPEVSNQVIYPYTDMLLHDMGEQLADGREDFEASGSEWRTAPLWGIGLSKVVTGHTKLLHDGRANNVTEAILWHGGEAEQAAAGFKALSKADREALVTFVNAL